MVAATITAPTWRRTERVSPFSSAIRSSHVQAPSPRCCQIPIPRSATRRTTIHTTETAQISARRLTGRMQQRATYVAHGAAVHNRSGATIGGVTASVTPAPYDHWPRYAELTALLEISRQRSGRSCSTSSRSGSRTRAGTSGLSRSPTARPARRREAGGVRRGQHPHDGGDRRRRRRCIWSIKLAAGYGSDERVDPRARTRGFYVIPRLKPDGVELALADVPRYVPPVVRPCARGRTSSRACIRRG